MARTLIAVGCLVASFGIFTVAQNRLGVPIVAFPAFEEEVTISIIATGLALVAFGCIFTRK